jgi:glycosyltransferase involved in cell wall biosynthesis
VRVLLVHNRYRVSGGEERHIDLLEEWLSRTGVDVRRFEVSSTDDVPVRARLKLGLTLTYRPAGARLMRGVLARERPDVVHFHNILPLLTPAALRAAQQYGSCVVLTIHNYRFACPAGTLLRNGRIHDDCIDGSSLLCGLRNPRGVWSESIAYGMALELQRRLRLTNRWVDAYVTPSAFVTAMLTRAGFSRDRIHTIHHGTPIDDAVTPVGDIVFYAGRLTYEKGIDTLLAASQLAPHVPLVIAGEGPLASVVEAAAGGTISYVGQITPASVAQLTRESRFTIAPSRFFESLCYSAIESMAHGRAVVASRLGALSEIVADGQTGVLVPPGDPVALASAMATLWSNRDRAARMGLNAWRQAQEQFSPLVQTRRLAELYERVLASSSARVV